MDSKAGDALDSEGAQPVLETPEVTPSTFPVGLYQLIGEIVAFTGQVDQAWTGNGAPGGNRQNTQGEVPRPCSME